MRTLTLFLIGASLLIVSQASPYPEIDDNENLLTGIPTSLIAEEELLRGEGEDLTPHSREKRSKKKVIINQYYGQPPYHQRYPGQYGNYGGHRGYPPYGYSDPYYERDGGRRHGAGKVFKKLKKFG